MFTTGLAGLLVSTLGISLSLGSLNLPALELKKAAPPSLATPELTPSATAQSAEELHYFREVKKRSNLTRWHRTLGIATWSAMALTSILGFIQYYNLYGIFAGQGSNPCVKGNAIFGQSQCTGTPLLHAAGAGITAGLYYTTFAFSLAMPDPDNADNGSSEFAKTLRKHKLLRWVHFGGMATQAVLGVVSANSELLGLDRANDYRTLQALSTLHFATGLITLGALTWAALLML